MDKIGREKVKKDWCWLWNNRGVLKEDLVIKELADFSFLIEQIPKIYCEITGGRLSKLTYTADTVITAFQDWLNENYVHKDDLKDVVKSLLGE